MRSALAFLCISSLAAQEADQPFLEEAPKWWLPSGVLRLERERFTLEPGRGDFDRNRARLHLRWEGGSARLRWILGSLHSLSNARNGQDLPRFENLRSNGSSLDLAAVQARSLGESGGGEAALGLIENPLLASEALWDPNLRILGAGGRLFWRSGGVEELSLRAVGGQVRLLASGRVSLAALQGVGRASTGPFEWTAHAGLWRMEARQEDAALFRRQNLGGAVSTGAYGSATGYADTEFDFRVLGLGAAYYGAWPIEIKGQRQIHSDGRGDELQVWLGSPRRAWWPQAGWIRQRLDANGALASVNGDQWWFHANADGNLFILALNLPRRWRLEARHLDQRRRGANNAIQRDTLALTVRF